MMLTPGEIAREQMRTLHERLESEPPDASAQFRVELAKLAALVEIADRLDHIGKSLDVAVTYGGSN